MASPWIERTHRNATIDAIQRSTNLKRAAPSQPIQPIQPTKRRKLPWLHGGESSSAEEDNPSVASGYLWALGPGSSRLGLDSANPPAPQNAFIQHKMSKSISQWTKEDLYRWYEEEDQKPRDWPYEWYHWMDSRPGEPFDQTVLTRQMERWNVQCTVCLLLQDPRCNSHGMMKCPRDEGHNASSVRKRLWRVIEDVEDDGIEGYGEALWCIYCHLPRSRCPAWTRDVQEPKGENEWHLTDGSRCRFGRTIGNVMAAMLGLNCSQFEGLWDLVVEWWDESEIRYNEGLDVNGWLASPMQWGDNDVMVMTRVFYQLDKVVEKMCIRKLIDKRRIELGAIESWDWLEQRSKAKQNKEKQGEYFDWARGRRLDGGVMPVGFHWGIGRGQGVSRLQERDEGNRHQAPEGYSSDDSLPELMGMENGLVKK